MPQPKPTGMEALVAGAVGAVLSALGFWALIAPRSFFDEIATFDPYNRHLIQDIGAFQIGLGLVLVLAVWARTDALTTAALGVGLGTIAHLGSHLMGFGDGGRPMLDVPSIGILGVVLVWIGARRLGSDRTAQRR